MVIEVVGIVISEDSWSRQICAPSIDVIPFTRSA